MIQTFYYYFPGVKINFIGTKQTYLKKLFAYCQEIWVYRFWTIIYFLAPSPAFSFIKEIRYYNIQ